MTSTRKTMMLLVMVVVMAPKEAKAQQTEEYDGEAESSCILGDVSVWHDFNPQSLEGIWYPAYRTHIPNYNLHVKMMRYEVEYKQFNDTEGDLRTFLVINGTVVYSDGACSQGVITYDTDETGMLISPYLAMNDNQLRMVKNKIYILMVDDHAFAMYSEIVIDGVVSKRYSNVVLAVRDDSLDLKLSTRMKDRLKLFCGNQARNLKFYERCQNNLNATCTA